MNQFGEIKRELMKKAIEKLDDKKRETLSNFSLKLVGMTGIEPVRGLTLAGF